MDDLISREVAIDGLDAHYVEHRNLNDWQEGWNAALDWVKYTYLDDLPAAQPPLEEFEWCTDCKEYDHERHCCHRFTKVIRQTVEELKVVRCKDCRYAKMTYDGTCKYCTYLADNFGINDAVYFAGDDYCSHAERRTDG